MSTEIAVETDGIRSRFFGFPGFYNSLLEDPSEENGMQEYFEEKCEKLGVTSWRLERGRDFSIDWNRRCEDVGKCYVECLKEELDLKKYDIEIELHSISSPKEYNFSTDYLELSTRYTHEGLRKLADEIEAEEKNKECFEKIIKQHFKSRSGFVSSYSDDPDRWLDLLRAGLDPDEMPIPEQHEYRAQHYRNSVDGYFGMAVVLEYLAEMAAIGEDGGIHFLDWKCYYDFSEEDYGYLTYKNAAAAVMDREELPTEEERENSHLKEDEGIAVETDEEDA